MTQLRKLFAPLAGVATVVVILTLVAPRAARAVAAVFVQVTNTVTAPAVTQNVPNLASQIVTLTAQVDASSFTKVFLFYQVLPQGGTSGTSYVTPGGQSLVITSMEFAPTAGSGDVTLVLLDGFTINTYEQWNVSAGSITDLQYPTGIVLGPSVAPIIVPQHGSTTGAFNVYIHGYLTAN
jgi:hypothetical protein